MSSYASTEEQLEEERKHNLQPFLTFSATVVVLSLRTETVKGTDQIC